MLKKISILHALVLVVLVVLCWLVTKDLPLTLSLGLGGVVMGMNLLILGWAWSLILNKKLIALGVLIIVSKYSILAAIIIFSLKQEWFNPIGFGAGVASLMLALVVNQLSVRD